MTKKQIVVLWMGFAIYAVCVLSKPVSRWFGYATDKGYIDWTWAGGIISKEFSESLEGSFHYGVVILIVTLLVSVTL